MPSKNVRPIIIIGCPRSGTTLLYTILGASSELQSLHNESRFIFRKFYQKKLETGISFASDALRSTDLNDEDLEYFQREFIKYSFKNRYLGKLIHKILRRNPLLKPIEAAIVEINYAIKQALGLQQRLLEKTPRNCFKIEMLDRLFPDAYFIYIRRDPKTNISSLIDGWLRRKSSSKSKRLPALRYKLNIKGYDGSNWRFALPPGWEEYHSSTIEDVCAYQWLKSNEEALKGLDKIPSDRKIAISYEELIQDTPSTIKRVCEFAGINYSEAVSKLAEKPPKVNFIQEKPSEDKWKKNEELINRILPKVAPLASRLGYNI